MTKYYTDDRKLISFDNDKKDCIICDLDGTICLHQGRSPYDLSKLLTDKPNPALVKLLTTLNIHYPIIFLSGREGTDQCKKDTFDWLCSNYMLPVQDELSKSWELKMRKVKDFRHDEIVKEEIYHNEIEPYYNVICVFDDRNSVVDMWRDLGILCNQVYYGDF